MTLREHSLEKKTFILNNFRFPLSYLNNTMLLLYLIIFVIFNDYELKPHVFFLSNGQMVVKMFFIDEIIY